MRKRWCFFKKIYIFHNKAEFLVKQCVSVCLRDFVQILHIPKRSFKEMEIGSKQGSWLTFCQSPVKAFETWPRAREIVGRGGALERSIGGALAWVAIFNMGVFGFKPVRSLSGTSSHPFQCH